MTNTTSSTISRSLSGCYTALITPFRDGLIDEPALRALVQRQIAGGVSGLVPCGTTGEAPALSAPEWDRVVAVVVETAERTRAGPRRHGLQQYGHRHRADAASAHAGRGRCARRHAVLQPPDARRTVPALRGDRGGGRSAARALQRARSHRGQSAPGDGRAIGGHSRHRRHQGGERVARPGEPDRARGAGDVRRPLRRRLAHLADDGRRRPAG